MALDRVLGPRLQIGGGMLISTPSRDADRRNRSEAGRCREPFFTHPHPTLPEWRNWQTH